MLTNPEVLAVDQDPLGRPAHRLQGGPNQPEVWTRQLEGGAMAVAVFNRTANSVHAKFTLAALGLRPGTVCAICGCTKISTPAKVRMKVYRPRGADVLGPCSHETHRSFAVKDEPTDRHRLSDAELLQLKRWNTPTIYNGWEQITRHDAGRTASTSRKPATSCRTWGPWRLCRDRGFRAQRPGAPPARIPTPGANTAHYVGSVPGPKIVVVQDLDKPRVIGAFWGEVTSNFHRALGCVGTIIDGAIRDLDEMNSEGFKALARRLCVGHAYATPVRWGCEVEVFGARSSRAS